MTTGRINQVTISQMQRWSSPAANTLYWPPTSKQEAFQGGCSLQGLVCPHTVSALWSIAVILGFPRWSVQAQYNQRREHLIPRSHVFQAKISLSKRQGSPPSVRTTIDRQHLARHAGSPGGSPSGYLTSGFSTSAINPHPSTSLTWVSKSTDVRLSQVVAGTHPPHTHLAHLIPNQHTLTCRYINDLVLRRPAYPQTGNVLRSWPFPSPIEQAYLELCQTTECKAEALFHNSFITKVHLLGPQHIRTWGRLSRFNPCNPPIHPSAGSFQLPFMC